MPTNLTMNPQETRHLDAPVYEIAVGVGSLVVTDNCGEAPVSETIAAGHAYHAYAKPSLALYTPEGAVLSVTYADEPQVAQGPPERPSGVSAKRAKKAA